MCRERERDREVLVSTCIAVRDVPHARQARIPSSKSHSSNVCFFMPCVLPPHILAAKVLVCDSRVAHRALYELAQFLFYGAVVGIIVD